jgi:signal transduction histidine kinase
VLQKVVKDAPADSQQNFPTVIANLPSSRLERRVAFGVIIFLSLVFGILAPFASTPLARVDAFIPALQTVLGVAELITAALLFAQYSIQPLHGVLALASGYIFSGLFAFLQTLAFPGAYSPDGLIGDPLSSAAYLFFLWHVAFPLAVIVYALSKGSTEVTTLSGRRTRATIGITIACVLAVTVGLTWAVTAGAAYLPKIFVNTTQQAPFASYMAGPIWVLSAVALVLLFVRKRTSLAVWLMVAVFATLPDLALTTVLTTVRFTLGWYTARSYALIASCTVLIALLTETTFLYARLANANLRLQRERADRLMSVRAATAAMAHEMKQPLTGISTSGAAGLRWLKRMPPDLDEVRGCIVSMVEASHRAVEMINSTLGLFKETASQWKMLQLNEVVSEVLTLVQNDLEANGISVTTEYKENLPQIKADPTQLQQVILNLTKNAIEAMASSSSGKRRLRLATGFDNSVASLYIQDTGPGITVKNKERIFDPFFTTKHTGTGLGLAICRAIVVDHGGSLRLTETGSHGTSFEVVLPIGLANGARA